MLVPKGFIFDFSFS